MALRRVDALSKKQSISALYPSIRLCHTQNDSLYQIKSEYDRICESMFEQKETSAMFLNIQVKILCRGNWPTKGASSTAFHECERDKDMYTYTRIET